MSDGHTVNCPHCDTAFLIEEVQLQQAAGRVRCGNCLQVFDGSTGEIEFTAPSLPEESESSPFELAVKPMAHAALPQRADPPSRIAHGLMLLLLVALALQLTVRHGSSQGASAALELDKLVVRPHPEVDRALRVDAILRNPTAQELPYPSLWLGFSNGHGEARAQRLFQPHEYLHGEHPPGIPANSRIQLSLSLQDPGHDAVNYVARLHNVTDSPN